MNGKGSKRRPSQVDNETLENNWNNIFMKRVIDISAFKSLENNRYADVVQSEHDEYTVHCYGDSSQGIVNSLTTKNLNVAEDYAEDWVEEVTR
jgi:hypothetical protein|tara:strand:+ start:525 stop:803 length:279 start_codon:yes stop_codon:yes gene_type:complete